jgi:hypothetical protein
MINLNDVQDGAKELERSRPSGSGQRDDPSTSRSGPPPRRSTLPLSRQTAKRRQGRIRGAGDKTLRDAGCRATKGFYPA